MQTALSAYPISGFSWIWSETASQNGVVCGGSALASVLKGHTATGGTRVAGSATVTHSKNVIGSGGAVVSGLARKSYTCAACQYICDDFWDDDYVSLTDHNSAWSNGTDLQIIDNQLWSISTSEAITTRSAGHSDYTLSADVTFQSDDADDEVWLLFRYQNSSNFWRVQIEWPDGNVRVIERTGNVESQKFFDLVELEADTPYSIVVTVKGSELYMTFATASANVTMSSLLTRQTVGLRFAAFSLASFDAFCCQPVVHLVPVFGGGSLSGSAIVLCTHNLTSSGGAVCRGQAHVPPIYDEEAQGGCRVGGSATDSIKLGTTPQGGAVLSGTAYVSVRQRVTAAGGARVSGLGQQGSKYDQIGTGGARTGGSARQTVRWVGSVSMEFDCSISVAADQTEGATVSIVGSCDISVDANIIARNVGTGGASTGGSAHVLLICRPVSTGGAVCGGSASHTVRHAGQVSVEGSCDISVTGTRLAGSGGGVVCSGTSKVSGLTHERPSGGVVAGGRAYAPQLGKCSMEFSCSITVAADVLSGTSCAIEASCDVQVDGNVIYAPGTAGGATTGGSAAVLLLYRPATSGGVVCSGRAQQITPVHIEADCSITVTGNVIHRPQIGGGLVCAGRAYAPQSARCSMVFSCDIAATGNYVVSASVPMVFSCSIRVHGKLKPKPLMLELVKYLKAQNLPHAGNRVFPSYLPQGATFPCVSLFRVDVEHDLDLTRATGEAESRVQVDLWSRKYSEIRAMSEAVRLALQGYSADMGSIEVKYSTLENRVDQYEPPEDGSDQGLHHRSLDFLIGHNVSTA